MIQIARGMSATAELHVYIIFMYSIKSPHVVTLGGAYDGGGVSS